MVKVYSLVLSHLPDKTERNTPKKVRVPLMTEKSRRDLLTVCREFPSVPNRARHNRKCKRVGTQSAVTSGYQMLRQSYQRLPDDPDGDGTAHFLTAPVALFS